MKRVFRQEVIPVTVITRCDQCRYPHRTQEDGHDYCKWCGHVYTTAPPGRTAYQMPSHPIPAPGKDTESRVDL